MELPVFLISKETVCPSEIFISEDSLAFTRFPFESLRVTFSPEVFTTLAEKVSPFFILAKVAAPSPVTSEAGLSVTFFIGLKKISLIAFIHNHG